MRDKGISDPVVLRAIADTPRELFIDDDSLRKRAYDDEALPIECGQLISQPFIVAYMTERLRVLPTHDVFEIGAGSGYQPAILAYIARHVYTIERHARLHRLAMGRLRHLGLDNVTGIVGDGTLGWPDDPLFNRIIVSAGVSKTPSALREQLADGGAMLLPVGPRRSMRLRLYTRCNGVDETQKLLPVRFVPLLSG